MNDGRQKKASQSPSKIARSGNKSSFGEEHFQLERDDTGHANVRGAQNESNHAICRHIWNLQSWLTFEVHVYIIILGVGCC